MFFSVIHRKEKDSVRHDLFRLFLRPKSFCNFAFICYAESKWTCWCLLGRLDIWFLKFLSAYKYTRLRNLYSSDFCGFALLMQWLLNHSSCLLLTILYVFNIVIDLLIYLLLALADPSTDLLVLFILLGRDSIPPTYYFGFWFVY